MGAEGLEDESLVGVKQNQDGSLDKSKAMRMMEGTEKATIDYLEDAKKGIDILMARVGSGGLTESQLIEIQSKASEIFNSMYDLGLSQPKA